MSSLDTAIRVLKCLSPDRPVLRVSDVSERLNLPKSTVSRLLRTLSEGGVLDRIEPSRHYVAGPVALQLGALYLARHDLLDLVDEAISGLVERYGFTGYVAVLEGTEVVVLRCRVGSYPLKFVLEVGTRQPAAAASLGIALLARLPDAVLDSRLASLAGGAAKVRRQIALFRAQDWIAVPCETVPGITAIGSAVAADGRSDRAIGFSLSFPDAAADDSLRRAMARDIAAVARRIADQSRGITTLAG